MQSRHRFYIHIHGCICMFTLNDKIHCVQLPMEFDIWYCKHLLSEDWKLFWQITNYNKRKWKNHIRYDRYNYYVNNFHSLTLTRVPSLLLVFFFPTSIVYRLLLFIKLINSAFLNRSRVYIEFIFFVCAQKYGNILSAQHISCFVSVRLKSVFSVLVDERDNKHKSDIIKVDSFGNISDAFHFFKLRTAFQNTASFLLPTSTSVFFRILHSLSNS